MFKQAITSLAIEFGPIVVFVILAEKIDFVTATAWFVALTALSLIVAFIKRKSFALFPFLVAVSVIGFGLATIISKNSYFFIFKDTIYNLAMGLTCLISLFFNKPLLEILFKDTFSMLDKGWEILTKRWMYMFFVLAASNEITRMYLTEEGWVNYKIFATIATAIFGFYQFTLSKKYRTTDSSEWGMKIYK